MRIDFPVSDLSLLHWRAKNDPFTLGRVGDARVHRSVSESLPVSSVDVSIQFEDLRAGVARRHNTVNAALASLMGVSFFLTTVASTRTWILYQSFRRTLLPYHAEVTFRAFLRNRLTTLSDRAREAHRAEQRRLLEETRAAIVAKRSKEALRGRLESLHDALRDAEKRRRIQECLKYEDVERMRLLVEELEGQAGQKTEEERLTLLLDTLKEYCTSEELDRCRLEAFQILGARGFREARSFVVQAHDQFHAKARELEKKEARGAEPAMQ